MINSKQSRTDKGGEDDQSLHLSFTVVGEQAVEVRKP